MGRRHFVRFVADDQVPTAVWRHELLLHILLARELVEACNDEVGFQEPVPGSRRLQLVVCQNLERQMKAPVQFVLPLLSQAAWG